MTDPIKAATVFYAKDIARIAAFYASVTGLQECERESDFVALQRDGFELVVVAIPERIAASIIIADPPRRREETPIKPVFFVESIDAARLLATAGGGALNPPTQEWRFRGWRVCDGQDPEGNVFQLRERIATGDSQ